jgi:hypothetical protein
MPIAFAILAYFGLEVMEDGSGTLVSVGNLQRGSRYRQVGLDFSKAKGQSVGKFELLNL